MQSPSKKGEETKKSVATRNEYKTKTEMHDFIVHLKKCRLVVEREFAYEPALFSLETKSAKYKKIVEGKITDFVVIK